jgi:chemotaxis protein MotB
MAEGHGGGGGERWLLTYADLITLLLAFFIIMYAGSKADLEKFNRLARGLAQAFGGGGGPIDTGGEGVLGQGANIFDFGTLSPERRQFLAISDKLQQFATEQGQQENISVNMRKEGIAVTLSNALLFPSGGVELSPAARSTLAKIGELIRPLPNEIRIEAHTDNLATDSSIYPTNWELSAARASRVARSLSEEENIEASRLAVLGYGEYRPLSPNDTREHRLLNRRADIVILYPQERLAPTVNLAGQDRAK